MTNVYAAIYKAQQAVSTVVKDSKNPHYKSSYASLGAVIEATRDALAGAGLCVLTMPAGNTEQGGPYLFKTTVIHESGACVEFAYCVPVSKNDAQGLFGALTYARRYALVSLLNLIVADDDGNEASGKATAVTVKSTAQAATKETTVDSVIAALEAAKTKDDIELIKSAAAGLEGESGYGRVKVALFNAAKRVK